MAPKGVDPKSWVAGQKGQLRRLEKGTSIARQKEEGDKWSFKVGGDLGAKVINDSKPFDLVGRHMVVEAKLITHDADREQVTVHSDQRESKIAELKTMSRKVMVMVVKSQYHSVRNPTYYVYNHVGAFRVYSENPYIKVTDKKGIAKRVEVKRKVYDNYGDLIKFLRSREVIKWAGR